MAKVESVIEGMKFFLGNALEDREKYLTRPENFTRNRKMTFWLLCLFILNQSKRSLSIELGAFFGSLKIKGCTKSAFSQARYGLKHVFFKDWNQHFKSLVYGKPEGLKRWKGFYPKGIDGTTLYLFEAEGMEEAFGTQSNQFVSRVMARAGYEVDLLNGYCTNAWLGHIGVGEQEFAKVFLQGSSPEDLLIYDMYFISFELLFRHLHLKRHFVMRAAPNFNNVVAKFVEGGKKQCVVGFPITDTALKNLKADGFAVDKNTTVKVRLLRIELDGGETEVLVTDFLCPVKYPHEDFKPLYGMRWGSETKFDEVKNKLQMEVFSGHKPEAVRQDFFATTVAVNLHTLIVNECAEQVEQISLHRENRAAINHNVTIGLLKTRLVEVFLTKSPRKIIAVLKELFLQNLEPVRPQRKVLRTKTVRRLNGKYQTFKNYRRAC